jgi:hypothetical protein
MKLTVTHFLVVDTFCIEYIENIKENFICFLKQIVRLSRFLRKWHALNNNGRYFVRVTFCWHLIGETPNKISHFCSEDSWSIDCTQKQPQRWHCIHFFMVDSLGLRVSITVQFVNKELEVSKPRPVFWVLLFSEWPYFHHRSMYPQETRTVFKYSCFKN